MPFHWELYWLGTGPCESAVGVGDAGCETVWVCEGTGVTTGSGVCEAFWDATTGVADGVGVTTGLGVGVGVGVGVGEDIGLAVGVLVGDGKADGSVLVETSMIVDGEAEPELSGVEDAATSGVDVALSKGALITANGVASVEAVTGGCTSTTGAVEPPETVSCS
jgi:hypothetical protein